MNDFPISIQGLKKVYKLYDRPVDRLRELMFRKPYHHEFIALDDIILKVKKGETLGIIGENGAGKSTLLKIVAKTLKPSAGEISINGRISSLLELGSGFHPEFTGMDNIYFYGSLIGIPETEMKDRTA
jgi:ABC-type polysaccharide/polyol phosphate transport system ATPase subunit